MTGASLTGLLERVVQTGRATLEGPAGCMDAALIDRAGHRIAAQLAENGIAPLEPVLVAIANRPADIAAMLGVWRAGAVVVPLSASAPAAVLAALKSRVGARMAIGPDGIEGAVESHPPRTLDHDAALVLFTSGSTGKPKGVMIGHGRLAGKIAALERLLPLHRGDVVLVPLQLTFIFGIWVSLLGLLAGARVVLMPRFTAAAMSQALANGATVTGVVPTMLRSLPGDAPPSAPNLRMLLTGGEPFGAPLAARVAAMFPATEVIDLYGLTETGSCDFSNRGVGASQYGVLGSPTEAVEFRLAGADGRAVGTGDVGELQIRTPFGMLGYFGAPELTSAAFADGYFRTGDLARARRDGQLELVGRRTDIISRGGIKVAPLELDHLFAAHPDVEAALTGSIPDERLGEAVHVLVVRRKGSTADTRSLQDWAAARLERGKLPDGIHFVDALPLGQTGKADRSAVAGLVLRCS